MTSQMDGTSLSATALMHLQNLLAAADLDATAEMSEAEGENATFAITGPDAKLLVGPQGQALDALQYLLTLMTNKGRDQRLRLTVDADGYRARRTQTLVNFAQQLAEQVLASGQEAFTDPLNAMERRIIHTALVDHPDVETYSEGDDPRRYVVVTPRSSEPSS